MSNPTELPDLAEAVRKLVKAKGRFHTEQNYRALADALARYDSRRAPPEGKAVTLLKDAARAWNNEAEAELDATMERIECFLLDSRAQPEGEAPQASLQKFDLTDYSRPVVYSNSANIAPAAQQAESGAPSALDFDEWFNVHSDGVQLRHNKTVEELRAALAAQSQGAPFNADLSFAAHLGEPVAVAEMARRRAQQAAAPGSLNVELVELLSEGVNMVAALADTHKAHDANTVRWLGAAGTLVDTLRSAPGTPEAPKPPFPISDDEIAALRRFWECATDGEGYDVEKSMMHRLAEMGLVQRKSGAYYMATEFGLYVLGEYTMERAAQLDGGQGEGA